MSRDRQIDVPDTGGHRLRTRPVARVREHRGFGVALVVAEVVGEFGLEASLEAGLDQVLDQPVTALQLDIAGVDAGIQVIQSPGGLQRGHAVALRTSPVFTVEFVYHGHHSAFVSGATPYTDHLTLMMVGLRPGV